MTNFIEKFDSYVCENDSITIDREGFTISARIERDTDYGIDDDDCHNEDQSVTGCNDEQFKKLLSARAAWLNDEWFYCGVVLSVKKGNVILDNHAASLWGIECNYPDSDNRHLTEVANELLQEAVETGKQVLKTLCK
jgi:hypothetical protein